MAERLCLTNVSKRHGARTVLDALSLSVADGEMLALLGPSGSGKTTALNLIAGLDTPETGEITLAGRAIFGKSVNVPPHKRQIGMIFQDQVLWPHMTVVEHLQFVLRAQGVSKSDWPARIREMLEKVRLPGRDSARPAELSGGERQRLSIARALIGKPALLLLDEPCANLDAPLKSEFLALLASLQSQDGFSAIYVTHDSAEAFEIATRAAVLDAGKLVQSGTCEELYRAPAAPAVARLVGGGVLVNGSRDGETVATAFGKVPAAFASAQNNGSALVFFRADELELNPGGELEGVVRSAFFDGRGWIVSIEKDGVFVRVRAAGAEKPGASVRFKARGPLRAFS